MINRLILWLALAGMVLALHLWIQKARGFDQGCLGLEKPVAAAEASDCREVGALPASHLLGVSNAAWGFGFYFGLALLSFGRLIVRPARARRLGRIGEMATAAAWLYTLYLVYEMAFVARAWCALCLISAGLVSLLLVLQVRGRWRGREEAVDEGRRVTEIGAGVAALFAAMGALIVVVLFVDRLGTRPLNQGSSGRELADAVGDILPRYIDQTKLEEMKACHFDPEAGRLPADALIGPATPFIGDPAGPQVVVFYDPNCPHCKVYHEEFARVIEKYRDRARFTVLPRMLWEESLRQVEALQVAEGSGRYFELWGAMFAEQAGPHHGMNVPQIAALFRRLGLDATGLEGRLDNELATVRAKRAAAIAAGLRGVPAVYINGRLVWSANRSEACLGRLIERVRAGPALAPEGAGRGAKDTP